jgi:hypothetical protein
MESLLAPPNVHNERYIRTKRERAGHLIPETPELAGRDSATD